MTTQGPWNRAQQRARQRRARMAHRLPRWRTRAHRRTLSVIWLLVPLAMIAMSVTLSWNHPWMITAFLVVLALWYPFWYLLRVLTTATAEAMGNVLDERELALRNKFSYVAFNVLLTTNILVIFYTGANENDPIIAQRVVFLLTSCMLLSVSVPTALLAWRMPDDDPEDLETPRAASATDRSATNPSTTSPPTTGRAGRNDEGGR